MFGFCFRKSSMAILAATTDPCPLESESGPVASLITPILTTPPEISAAQTGDPKATKPAKMAAAIAIVHPRSEVPSSFSSLAVSQRNPTSLFGGPIAGVLDFGRLKGQRETGKRLPAGRDAFHEVLDLLQIAARPFFLETNVLPSGLSIHFFGDVDAGELLLAGLIAHHVRVGCNIRKQRAAAGMRFDQVANAAHDHVPGKYRRLGAIGEGHGERAPILDVNWIGLDEGSLVRPKARRDMADVTDHARSTDRLAACLRLDLLEIEYG